MFWRQLRENCSHLGFVWLILRHIMSEYGDLLWNSPYAVQMEEKFAPEKTTSTNVYVSWSVTVALKRNVHLTAKGRCDIQV